MVRRQVAVVVPARDEVDRIGACLDALLAARRVLLRTRRGTTCTITVVLDACTDGTAAVARRYARALPGVVTVLEVRVGAVGPARAAGVAAALAAPGPRLAHRWVANTDADSRVTRTWLVQQADALRRGVEVLVGAVVPDPRELAPDVLARWRLAHPLGVVLGHTHGANLGIRADVLRALGGFAPVDEHEDVALVDRARAAGRRVAATGAEPVTTSGRLVGRTPGGYAAHLHRTYVSARVRMP